jgi:hypothetical protein
MMAEGKEDRIGHGGDRKSKVSRKPLKPSLATFPVTDEAADRMRRKGGQASVGGRGDAARPQQTQNRRLFL